MINTDVKPQSVFETLWTDGIDKRTSKVAISPHALTRCRNAQYRDGTLEKAAGIEIVYDAAKAVESTFEWNGKHIYSNGQNLYYTDYTTETLIGVLSGTSHPYYVLYDADLLVASGNNLQYIDTSWTITTVATSPNLDRLWIRGGRVCGSLAGDDFAYESKVGTFKAVGDWDTSPQPAEDWSSVAAVDYINTPLYYEIGYKDGLDIVSVSILSDDIIFFKEKDGKRKQYRLQGYFPDWTITELAPPIHVYSALSAINNIFIIGKDGFNSFTNVIQYGDLARDETGSKVNVDMIQRVTDDAAIWHIPTRKCIYVKIRSENVLWCFYYTQKCSDGTVGAWTQRYLSAEPWEVWQFENETYIAFGNKIGRMDDDITTDDSVEFTMDCTSKLFVGDDDFDVTQYKLYLENVVQGAGTIQVGGYIGSITFGDTDPIAYSDTSVAYSNTTTAYGKRYSDHKERIRALLSGDVELALKVTSGKVRFVSLKVWTGVVASG